MTDQEYITLYLSSKGIPRMKRLYGEINESNLSIIPIIYKKYHDEISRKSSWVWKEQLYKLLVYADIKEIVECFSYVINSKGFSNTLDSFKKFYGEIEGTRRYKEHHNAIYPQRKGIDFCSIENLCIKYGISEEEAELKKKQRYDKSSKTRINKIANDPSFVYRTNPSKIEFYHFKGIYDEKEITERMASYRRKTVPKFEKYISERFSHEFSDDDRKLVEYALDLDPTYKRDNLYEYLYGLMFYALRESKETLEWCFFAMTKFFDKSPKEKGKFILDNLILRYGNIAGKRKYGERNEKCLHSLENYIIRYGEEGEAKHKEYLSLLGNSLENCIRRHGKELGNIKYKEHCQRSILNNPVFPLHYINKGYSQEEANEMAEIVQSQTGFYLNETYVRIGNASKSSLRVLIPVYKWLRKSNFIKRKEVLLGVRGSNEYALMSDEAFYMYDFTIPSINIIIEYNGPYHIKLINESLVYDKYPKKINEEQADKIYQREIDKLAFARSNGFKVLVIWYDTPIKENIEICKRFILENL